MASTFQKQIAELEEYRDLVLAIRAHAVSEGGKLTQFGQDFVHTCLKYEFPKSQIAKIVDVTPGAISQWAKKLFVE